VSHPTQTSLSSSCSNKFLLFSRVTKSSMKSWKWNLNSRPDSQFAPSSRIKTIFFTSLICNLVAQVTNLSLRCEGENEGRDWKGKELENRQDQSAKFILNKNGFTHSFGHGDIKKYLMPQSVKRLSLPPPPTDITPFHFHSEQRQKWP